MRGRPCALLLLLLLVFIRVESAAAQTTGTISGSLQDASGGVLPGVTVTVRNSGTGVTRSVISSLEGRFVFPALPPGGYDLRAELAGFTPHVRTDIALATADTVSLAITLHLGELAIEEVVNGVTPLVNRSTSELSYLVGSESIERLPLNGRNYTDLALLQPGVNAFAHRDGGSVVAHGLGMSVNGQDPRSNVYLLDGTLQNDFTNGPAGSAAGTTLGVDTVREFRVETNAYAAEFGRNSGGQISVVSKSGTNAFSGTGFEFHRNDVLDAANFFDTRGKPDFLRNQFGATLGGPIATNRAFFFLGYEGLMERLGKSIATVVPDDDASRGLLPDPSNPGSMIAVPIDSAVAPYLAEFPRANGPPIGQGIAAYTFPFRQTLDEHFLQGRIDYSPGNRQQGFGRYTLDDADQFLPTDYPQFPRQFISRNQFFTGEHRLVISPALLNTVRIGFSRTRIGQHVEANTSQPLGEFVVGRGLPGDIDIGGLKRFGPQSSANLRLVQNVFSVQDDLVRARGGHLFKAGALVERYQDNMVNPTFSLGIYTFPDLGSFLRNRPSNFAGLSPDGAIDRYWRFTLFGLYAQDEWRARPRLTLNGGMRYEFSTLPIDIYGRDSALRTLSDPAPTVGPLYRNPTYRNLSPRGGFAWDLLGDGRTSIRGGYGLYFNTNNQQNLIVTVTNPPATPRFIIANPTFPTPPFERGVGNSIRPVQWDLENPRVHVFNMNLQREIWWHAALTVGYGGPRGTHLLRSGDVNTAAPITLADGTLFIPAGTSRRNPAFSTIELKSSDGESWYDALIIDLRRRWGGGFAAQSSYALSRSVDTTQASTFFSDATNGTTSAFPEYIPGYNKGPSDFDSRHNWVANMTWALPSARGRGVVHALLGGWQISGIWTMRSGNPLTAFVQTNRSRSLWNPSRGPGVGQDRPSYAPGYGPGNAVLGRVDQWFDPKAFVLQPAGTFGNTGRGDFTGPTLRTLDAALSRNVPWARLGAGGFLQVRFEGFNILNRANFGPPSLLAFAGTRDGETPFATFGRISTTVTSARQIQIGIRAVF